LNDRKHGEDCILKILNRTPFEIKGKFKQGELIYGQCTLPDGSFYEGEFEKLLPHGKGLMKYNNGNDYRGQF